MAVSYHEDGVVEVFKFKESGWFELFQEVLDLRRDEKLKYDVDYIVTYVGPSRDDNLIVRMIEKTD